MSKIIESMKGFLCSIRDNYILVAAGIFLYSIQ